MDFSPFNPIIKLCLQGMLLEEKGHPEEAAKLFLEGWHKDSKKGEKFLVLIGFDTYRNLNFGTICTSGPNIWIKSVSFVNRTR